MHACTSNRCGQSTCVHAAFALVHLPYNLSPITHMQLPAMPLRHHAPNRVSLRVHDVCGIPGDESEEQCALSTRILYMCTECACRSCVCSSRLESRTLTETTHAYTHLKCAGTPSHARALHAYATQHTGNRGCATRPPGDAVFPC